MIIHQRAMLCRVGWVWRVGRIVLSLLALGLPMLGCTRPAIFDWIVPCAQGKPWLERSRSDCMSACLRPVHVVHVCRAACVRRVCLCCAAIEHEYATRAPYRGMCASMPVCGGGHLCMNIRAPPDMCGCLFPAWGVGGTGHAVDRRIWKPLGVHIFNNRSG